MTAPLLPRLARKVGYYYRLLVKRDPFLWTVRRWFRDKGDETLRLDYPLTAQSVVLDVGGYRGDFADAIHRRYGCHVYVFEPVHEYYMACVGRFDRQPKIQCFNFGLGATDAVLPISIKADGSSLMLVNQGLPVEHVRVRSVADVLKELHVNHIDLVKINIEGGEFDLLPAFIQSGWITKTNYLQIQFHNFVPDAVEKRQRIREALCLTHEEMWNYEFVWESWKRQE